MKEKWAGKLVQSHPDGTNQEKLCPRQIVNCDNFVTSGEQDEPHKQLLLSFGFSYQSFNNSICGGAVVEKTQVLGTDRLEAVLRPLTAAVAPGCASAFLNLSFLICKTVRIAFPGGLCEITCLWP